MLIIDLLDRLGQLGIRFARLDAAFYLDFGDGFAAAGAGEDPADELDVLELVVLVEAALVSVLLVLLELEELPLSLLAADL